MTFITCQNKDKVPFLQKWFNVLNKDGCIDFDDSVSEPSLGRPMDSISDLLLQTEEEIKVEKIE